MSRPRSRRILEIKAALMVRLRHETLLPGTRFLSARALASRHGVSYQTAHRLLRELHTEGLLRRVPASGTFMPGPRTPLRGGQQKAGVCGEITRHNARSS
ncbi:MAG: GntR family transcriptional regulator [Opitutaceae bacterium]|nr:GntR family transcriptional regulator [Opitutaceae bacterium]